MLVSDNNVGYRWKIYLYMNVNAPFQSGRHVFDGLVPRQPFGSNVITENANYHLHLATLLRGSIFFLYIYNPERLGADK